MTVQNSPQLTNSQLRFILDELSAVPPGEPADLNCPRCGAATMNVERTPCPPHAIWFEITCSGCGIHERVQVTSGQTA